jgi:hypothetical protein
VLALARSLEVVWAPQRVLPQRRRDRGHHTAATIITSIIAPIKDDRRFWGPLGKSTDLAILG